LESRVGDDGDGGITTISSLRMAGSKVVWLSGYDDRGTTVSSSVHFADLERGVRPLGAAVDAEHDRDSVRALQVTRSGRVGWIQEHDGGFPGGPPTGVQAWDGFSVRLLDASPPSKLASLHLNAGGASWRSDGNMRSAKFGRVTGSTTAVSNVAP
jgi:hypothetical protein